MKSHKIERQDIAKLRKAIRSQIENNFYNIFMDEFEFPELIQEQIDFIMKEYWNVGTVAGFPIKNTDEVAFAPYSVYRYNLYSFPVAVELINLHQMPTEIVPTGLQIVHEDVALGWLMPNQKSMKYMLSNIIDRITAVEMVINTNLNIHKLPFMVGVTPEDKNEAQDIIDRILNDETVIFADFKQLNNVQALSTNAPYIIDKLYAYKVSLENEALTLLGVDNAQVTSDSKELTLDQVNANNAIINLHSESMLNRLKAWLEDLSTITGRTYTVEKRQQLAESVYEDTGMEVSGGDNGGTEDNGKN